ncbi:hypothetical protein AC579_8698 [Pseudocercospora musae]|uniref:Uncharacterized protein n=1 Tax=Pseudocercospora musae TaxID=113226 RepID=A0A139I0I2_9PEZI|nr:hypothetical protein AC579_8698 [Pseudocercospora musae]
MPRNGMQGTGMTAQPPATMLLSPADPECSLDSELQSSRFQNTGFDVTGRHTLVRTLFGKLRSLHIAL